MGTGSERDRTIGLVLTILGLFLGAITWSMNRVSADVNRVEGRLDSAEVRSLATQRELEQRLARIEAKLDRLALRFEVGAPPAARRR